MVRGVKDGVGVGVGKGFISACTVIFTGWGLQVLGLPRRTLIIGFTFVVSKPI